MFFTTSRGVLYVPIGIEVNVLGWSDFPYSFPKE